MWSNFHKDDILSIDLHRPSRIVASSSYDGDIKVWSLETGHVSCVLNANQYAGSMHARPVIPLELKRKVSENNAGWVKISCILMTIISRSCGDCSVDGHSSKLISTHICGVFLGFHVV